MTKLKRTIKETTSKLSLTKATKQLSKYLTKKNIKWEELHPHHISKFVKDLIWTKFTKQLKLKPYIIRQVKYNTLFILKLKFGGNLELFRRAIDRGARKASEIVYHLVRPVISQADIFSLKEALEMVEWLSGFNEKHKRAALMLNICFLTAGRTGDLLCLWWETTKVVNNGKGIFWISEIRCGKNNKIPKTRQQLTIEIGGESTKLFEELWDWYVMNEHQKGYDKGKVFDTYTGAVTYYYKKASNKLGYNIRRVTGHSGRNSTLTRLFEAKVSDTNINLFMRWNKDSKMIFNYRNMLLETSNIAAPHLLRIYDEDNYKHIDH